MLPQEQEEEDPEAEQWEDGQDPGKDKGCEGLGAQEDPPSGGWPALMHS